MSTALDLPFGEVAPLHGAPLADPAGPTLRLVPSEPLDFDDAVRRLRPRLQRYAVRRLGDAHEAEELVQEALLRAYTHREQLLTEEDLSAWSTVVTGRLVIDRLRVRGRSTTVADVPEGHRTGRDTADIVVAKDEARTALDALDAMPTRQAALLWAREVEGHSYEELCKRFDMTEPAVRSVLTRARKALRKEYAVRGGTLPVGGLAVLAPWIASLTRVDKLRRLVSRATAPAALGAVAVTTLGGLILSPFGIGGFGTDGTFSPSEAVVSSHTTGTATVPAAFTTPVVPATAAPRTAAAHVLHPGSMSIPTQGYAPGGSHARLVNRLNCTDSEKVTDGTPAEDLGAFGASCESRTTELQVGGTLPANPTGIRQVAVGQNQVDCPDLPAVSLPATSPLVRCTAPTQLGAQK